jgi:hypothetical protein
VTNRATPSVWPMVALTVVAALAALSLFFTP